jgi:hypothetical protein
MWHADPAPFTPALPFAAQLAIEAANPEKPSNSWLEKHVHSATLIPKTGAPKGFTEEA